MVGVPVLPGVVLTGVFVATGGYCADRCARPRPGVDGIERINDGAHLLMTVSMIAMVWTAPLLVSWQMSVFAIACGSFVVQAVGVPLTVASMWSVHRAAAGDLRLPHAHGGMGRWRCLHHAAVMAGMVWMLDVMARMPTSMPGMTMPGPLRTGPGAGAVFGGYYLAAAAVLIVVAVGGRRSPVTGHGGLIDDLCHALMTLGMAVMLMLLA